MNEKTIKVINFIKDYYKNTNLDYAVIGVSGGKDSSVVASLCVHALGKDKVLGVIMPNGEMSDFSDAQMLCTFLDIKNIVVNIGGSNNLLVDTIKNSLQNINIDLSEQGKINIAPRFRMATLYAIANSVNGLVFNTSNYSEKVVGYCTKWGDNVGDIAPLIHLTAQEVVEMGQDLGLPDCLALKTPSDGITGRSDEANFGFSYNDLQKYINGEILDENIKQIINNRIKQNAHKSKPIPSLSKE